MQPATDEPYKEASGPVVSSIRAPKSGGNASLTLSALQRAPHSGSRPGRRSADGDDDQGAAMASCRVRPGATLGATRTNDFPIRRTSVDNRQERARGHGLI